MRAVAFATALLLLAVPATAQEIIFEEGFESGFDGTGWIASAGGWQLDSTHVRSGTSALQLVDPTDYYVTYDFGSAQTNTVLEVWFYDDLSSVRDTHVGVTAAPDYLTSTSGHLLIGTDCTYGPDNYLISEGWHSAGYFELLGPRSHGWHQVKIQNVDGTNHCYLDGTLVHSTDFQGDWQRLVLMENNKCTDGVSWFDDVSLTSTDAPSTGDCFLVDDFDTGLGSIWQVTDPAAVTVSPEGHLQIVFEDLEPLRRESAILDVCSYGDFLAEFRCRDLNGSGGKTFAFRLNRATGFGYAVTFRSTLNDVVLGRKEIGVEPPNTVASAPLPHESGQWLDVSVSAVGGNIQISVDGEQVINYVDSDPLLDGAVMFSSSGGATLTSYAQFDDLHISPLPLQFSATPGLPNVDQARSAAWGQTPNNRVAELYVTRRTANSLLEVHNDGTVTGLSTAADSGNGMSSLWFDIDNNGRLDLLVVNKDSDNVFYYQLETSELVEAGFGTLLAETGSRTVEALDVDLDGDLDLILTTADGSPDAVLERTASGFQTATPAPLTTTSRSTASATADYDNDGDPDIYVVRSNEPNILVRNDGGGVWTDVTTPLLADAGLGNSASWGDYDGDGWLDLALTNANPPNRIFRNDQSGGFEEVTPAEVAADSSNGNAAWVDYDNDGRLDLFYTRGPGSDALWRNGSSGWENKSVPPLAVSGNHAGAAWADMDSDGDLDLFQAEFDEGVPSVLLKNALDNGNGWLEVDLVGTMSNRFGVGARLEVYAGGQKQIRDVLCSAGNKSQHMITAHVGLGEAAVVDSLIVKWPSGIVQTSYDVAVNQKLRIVEDANSTAVDQPPSGRATFALHDAVPNPFNPSTEIRFSLAESRRATLSVYDLSGRLVRTLLDEPVSAGFHSVTWNGRDESGRQVSSGVYLYQLKAGNYIETKRMVLLK